MSSLSKEVKQAFLNPLSKDNPVIVQILGICSALAVTAKMEPAFVMGISVICVLAFSNVILSLIRKTIPTSIRIIVQLVVVAALVVIVDQVLKAFAYDVSVQLSVFIGLIITNCIIMGRLEAFALTHRPWLSFLDGVGNGIGYAAILLIVAFFRELLGSGSLFGFQVVPQSWYDAGYSNCGLMILPPMALIVVACIIWVHRARHKDLLKQRIDMDNLNLFIKSIFVDNMVFAYFLGMCSFLAVSKNVKTAFGLGVAVSFVLMIALPITWCINQYLLVPGALSWLGQEYAETDLSFLGLIMFIAVIAALVQILEMVIEKYSPSLYNSLGIFLPLIAVNCAILGAVLFMQQREFDNAWTATVYGAGSGIGWLLAITALAAIRERLSVKHIPAPLRGVGISFIITGLMGIAFMSFLGIKL